MRADRRGPVLGRAVARLLHGQQEVCREGDRGVRAGSHDVGPRLPPAAPAVLHPPPPFHRAHRPLPARAVPRVGRLPHDRGARRAA
eukprot:6464763-Prymnesium_polylepis.1